MEVYDSTDLTGLSTGTSCSNALANAGYGDIQPGTEVVVTNQNNTVLATGTLGKGRIQSDGGCGFFFNVSGLPNGETQYGFTVSHRGTIWYTPSQLKSSFNFVGLSLGNSSG
jgi:hypothetical protein